MSISEKNGSPESVINSHISLIQPADTNRISGYFLDESLLEFFLLKEEISIPPIAVSELDYNTGISIVKNLTAVIPEFLRDHSLLVKRKPSSEQHSLHFIKGFQGRVLDFVHILRFDFKPAGGYGKIEGKGDNKTFPGYKTDRIRYKSRLVPVKKGSNPELIDSMRIKSQLEVDTDGKRFTSVFFDEYSTTEISIDFSIKSGDSLYIIPPKLYQFIAYDYFTACLNVPDPGVKKLSTAVELFEPLFCYLYFQYRERSHEISENELSVLDNYLLVENSVVRQRPLLQNGLREFFSYYKLFRDDSMMLSGLREIITG